MASETDQLARDFEEVNKLLTQYPQIQVTLTEGDPPATYEVEYQLTGLTRQADGNIGQTSSHLLRINLPFGYPHFPPTVKPLTPLFHPDIDPDAVRIASYWQQNPSLAELVLHMGEMICAKNYNLEEPFNQEAADWYGEHSNEFPLDEIQQGQADLEVGDLSLEEESDRGLSLEIDVAQENIDAQLKEIQHHIDRNQVVTAGKLLTALPSSSPEIQRLEKIVSSALSKRDKLIQELEELENEDRFSEAYKLFEKVREIAIDTPALSDVGQRLQQSQAMLDTFALPNATENEQGLSSTQGKKVAKKKKTAEKSPEKTKQKEKIQIERKGAKPPLEIPVKTILSGLVLLATVGGCTLLYTNGMDKVTEAERNWIEIKYRRCTTPEQFKQKRIQAEKLLVNLKSVYVPGLGQKKIEVEIHNLLNSPDFKKGESGDLEYKGDALPASVIKTLEPIDKKIDKAARADRKKEFAHALALYQEALTEAETAKPGALEPHATTTNAELDKRIQVINEKITKIQTQAGQEEKFKKRNEAEKKYQEAIAFFQKLKKKESEPSSPQDMDITSDQWGECAEKMHNTERLLNEYPEISSPERRKELRTLLAYSRLYQELGMARQAYEKGDFTAAISEYQSALHLLKEERTALDAIYNDAVLKVGQTVIMLNVSLELRKAVEAENHNDLRSSLSHYKETLRIIRTSQADRDDNLKKLERYVRSKIQEQSLAAAKSSNQEWWKKNYERIFKKQFPSSRNAPLSNPRIHFIKVQNGQLLYTIQCTEKKGIKLTLELTYQYDLATGEWSPYHGKL